MLKLGLIPRKLTQGQPAVRRSFVIQRTPGPAAEAAAGAPVDEPLAEPLGPAEPVDVRELAHQVYDLMRADLTIELERRLSSGR